MHRSTVPAAWQGASSLTALPRTMYACSNVDGDRISTVKQLDQIAQRPPLRAGRSDNGATIAAPRTARGIETCERLVKAGLTEFAFHGYVAARVESITDRAGVGYGTFYRYFKNKAALIAQVADEVYADTSRRPRARHRAGDRYASASSMTTWARSVPTRFTATHCACSTRPLAPTRRLPARSRDCRSATSSATLRSSPPRPGTTRSPTRIRSPYS